MNVMMLDCETTNSLEDPIAYDVGFQVFDENGIVLDEASMVNSDIFLDKGLMESAFFADKIPQYWEDVKAGKRSLCSWYMIKKIMAQDCKEYEVKIACAHNAMFDNRALNTTQRLITTSKYRYFLPYGIEWWDTLKMVRRILKDNEQYGEFCYDNDYLTSRGCRRYTAEIVYRFLSGENDFAESHTGLEDVKIERKIFEFCLAHAPEIDGRLWSD